jgi:hypothetical protein
MVIVSNSVYAQWHRKEERCLVACKCHLRKILTKVRFVPVNRTAGRTVAWSVEVFFLLLVFYSSLFLPHCQFAICKVLTTTLPQSYLAIQYPRWD